MAQDNNSPVNKAREEVKKKLIAAKVSAIKKKGDEQVKKVSDVKEEYHQMIVKYLENGRSRSRREVAAGSSRLDAIAKIKSRYRGKEITDIQEDELINEIAVGHRVKILSGMKEFIGKTGTVVTDHERDGKIKMYRVKFDEPVEVPHVGKVKDDLWHGPGLKRLKEETINEISTEKLSNYIKKAVDDHARSSHRSNLPIHQDQKIKYSNRATKRKAGINKAVDRVVSRLKAAKLDEARLSLPVNRKVAQAGKKYGFTAKSGTMQSYGYVPSPASTRAHYSASASRWYDENNPKDKKYGGNFGNVILHSKNQYKQVRKQLPDEVRAYYDYHHDNKDAAKKVLKEAIVRSTARHGMSRRGIKQGGNVLSPQKKKPAVSDYQQQKQFEKDSDKGWDEYDKHMREEVILEISDKLKKRYVVRGISDIRDKSFELGMHSARKGFDAEASKKQDKIGKRQKYVTLALKEGTKAHEREDADDRVLANKSKRMMKSLEAKGHKVGFRYQSGSIDWKTSGDEPAAMHISYTEKGTGKQSSVTVPSQAYKRMMKNLKESLSELSKKKKPGKNSLAGGLRPGIMDKKKVVKEDAEKTSGLWGTKKAADVHKKNTPGETVNEAKKWRPGMSKKEIASLKVTAKAHAEKRKVARATPKVSAPAPEAKKDVDSGGSRLDWFNKQPELQRWLRANVHPADRERVMGDIWNSPPGKAHDTVAKYKSGELKYRKPPKPGP